MGRLQTLLVEPPGEGGAIDEAEHEERKPFVFAGIEELHQVAMLESREHAYLFAEPAYLADVAPNDLYRDLPLE